MQNISVTTNTKMRYNADWWAIKYSDRIQKCIPYQQRLLHIVYQTINLASIIFQAILQSLSYAKYHSIVLNISRHSI